LREPVSVALTRSLESGQIRSPRADPKDVPGSTGIPSIPDEPCCISEIVWAVPIKNLHNSRLVPCSKRHES